MTDAIEPSHKEDIAKEILASVKARIGDAWNGLTQDDRSLIADIAADAAVLQLQTLATPRNTPAYTALHDEVRQINAQMLNVASMKAADLQAAFWDGFTFVAGKLASVVFAAVISV